MGDLVQKVAYEYYYQGTEIQYDQKNNRRNLNSVPEDATAYKEIYLDCSSYVNSIYHYIFGINITSTPTTAQFDDFAKENFGSNSEVIYYIDVNDYPTDEAKEAILAEIQSNLQVGDLITYRHNSNSSVGGHVMLYIGDNKFLHCTGSSFNYNNDPSSSYDQATSTESSTGAIVRSNASILFSSSGSRYLFSNESGKEVLSFSVLRPLNRNGLRISEQAYLRYQLQGITIEKVAFTPHMSTVNRGEDITYTITLTNKNNVTVNDIEIRDVINSLCTYKNLTIDNGGNVSGQDVLWNIASLASGATINLSYTVMVNNDAQVGSIIESNNATVNGIKTNKIYHTIGGLNDSDYETLKTKALALVGTDYSADSSDGFKMALDLYYNSFGSYFVSNTTTATNIVNKLIYDNRENNTIDKTCSYYPLVNPNFYGGLLIKSGQVQDIERTRIYKNEYFETGDIIVLHNSYDSKKYTYIFVDSSTIIGLDASGKVAKLFTTESAVSTFVSQLIAYNRFVVLRPALTIQK